MPAEVARQKREDDSLVDMELPAPLLTCTECRGYRSGSESVTKRSVHWSLDGGVSSLWKISSAEGSRRVRGAIAATPCRHVQSPSVIFACPSYHRPRRAVHNNGRAVPCRITRFRNSSTRFCSPKCSQRQATPTCARARLAERGRMRGR